MDTMQVNSKIITLYKIKETNSKLVYFCCNDINDLFIVFATKTGFNEVFSCDFKKEFNFYDVVLKQYDSNFTLINAANEIQIVEHNIYLNILSELIWKLEYKKIKNLYQFITGLKNTKINDELNFKICRVILQILINENLYFENEKDNQKLAEITNNFKYDIIDYKVILEQCNNILKKYLTILDDNGLYLKSIERLFYV